MAWNSLTFTDCLLSVAHRDLLLRYGSAGLSYCRVVLLQGCPSVVVQFAVASVLDQKLRFGIFEFRK